MSLSWECSEGEVDYGFSDVEPEGNTSGDTPPQKPTQVADQESREAAPPQPTKFRPRVVDSTQIARRNQFSTGKQDLWVLQRAYRRSIHREEEEKEKKRKAEGEKEERERKKKKKEETEKEAEEDYEEEEEKWAKAH